jgi:uncharacterized lipoprotein YajG
LKNLFLKIMNKQKLASSIVLLFSLFLMVSCTNEPVDPTLAAQLAAANSQTSSTGIYKWKYGRRFVHSKGIISNNT